MAIEGDSTANLDKPSFAASDVRGVTGLSYRQLNEWDKRSSLPHEREGAAGWRKTNAWQAIALAIISELHKGFGIPLVKQRALLQWMLGEAPTFREYQRLLRAEDWLYDFSEEEKAANNQKLREALKDAERLENGLVLLRPRKRSDSDNSKSPTPPADPRQQALRLINGLVDQTLPRLAARGWNASKGQTFARRFYSLTVEKKFGLKGFAEIHALRAEALSANDVKALRAVDLLGCVLLPLFEAAIALTAGFPVFLVTDLDQSYFVDEHTYLDWMRQDVFPKTAITLQVNEHMNAVLETAIGKTFPVTLRAAEVESDNGDRISEKERQVLELLRTREFDRLIIEPKERGYRFEVQRDLSAEAEQDVARILAEHDYQSVTVKKSNGKIVRVSQSVSILTQRQPRDDGKARPQG